MLIDELERVARGENDRLMIFMPPGSAKSTYASVLFPPWFLAQRPGLDVIGASHGAKLAEDFSGRVLRLIKQNAATLGYDLLTENVELWRTTNNGVYRAAGAGGSITGRRADLIVIDDPYKGRAEAESETIRDTVWNWYRAEAYTRLKPRGRIVMIMTRWHEDDLGGRLLAEMASGGDQWRVLKLPALANAADDPLGREINEPLWPEWENREALSRKRAAIGEREFGSLYQQDPQPPGAAFFSEELLLVDGKPIGDPPFVECVFAEIDTAIKTGQTHDGTAVSYFGYNLRLPVPLYVLDWDIQQIEGASLETWLPSVFENLEVLARRYRARYGSIGAYVEDKNSGTVLLQQARQRGWPAEPIESKLTSMGKNERALDISGYLHSGQVKIVEDAYQKRTTYKGHYRNHLMWQFTRFRLDLKDQQDDLFDTLCYGVMLGCGAGIGF